MEVAWATCTTTAAGKSLLSFCKQRRGFWWYWWKCSSRRIENLVCLHACFRHVYPQAFQHASSDTVIHAYEPQEQMLCTHVVLAGAPCLIHSQFYHLPGSRRQADFPKDNA